MRGAYINKRRVAPAGYVAITALLAKKLYDEGKEIVLCTNEVSAFHVLGGWYLGCRIKKDVDIFENIVQQYLLYNAGPEVGWRAVFYTTAANVKE